MDQRQILTRTEFEITVTVIGDEVSNLYITDRNLYPDSDSRSKERWRQSGNGITIPINDREDLKRIKKLFK